jgi:lipopolysaccharide biosynthesis glycosyltransferase
VWYPEDLADMVNQFKICATAKILVHEMFPTVDAGIVLDTDIVVMDDITNLWNNFEKFDSVQMAALAPVESHYSNVHNFPYYGLVGMGLNAGVILFNMTRMRRMVGGGFTEAIRVVWHKYADKLHLAEQDMLNIIFSTSPR